VSTKTCARIEDNSQERGQRRDVRGEVNRRIGSDSESVGENYLEESSALEGEVKGIERIILEQKGGDLIEAMQCENRISYL